MWLTAIDVTGIVAWVLLCADVLVGSMSAGGMARYPLSGRNKLRWHPRVGLLLLATVAAHIGLILVDRYKGWDWHDVLQVGEGSGGNDTLARNCAVTALWLLLILLTVTTAKTYIPRRWWQRTHRYGALTILVLATIHGLYAGTGHHGLFTFVAASAALTFLASAWIVRWSLRHTRLHRGK